jgi:hypothetical protein
MTVIKFKVVVQLLIATIVVVVTRAAPLPHRASYPAAVPPQQQWGAISRDMFSRQQRRTPLPTVPAFGQAQSPQHQQQLQEQQSPVNNLGGNLGSGNNRALVTAAAGGVGTYLGLCLSTSTIERPVAMGAACGACTAAIAAFHRGDGGDLARAVGTAAIFVLQRSWEVRKNYDIGGRTFAALQLIQRRPFPPWQGMAQGAPEPSNLWRDTRHGDFAHSVDFSMGRSVLAVGAVASFGGVSLSRALGLPLPTWMVALGCGGSSAYAAVRRCDALGDLARAAGMGTAALCGTVLSVDRELQITSKATRVVQGVWAQLRSSKAASLATAGAGLGQERLEQIYRDYESRGEQQQQTNGFGFARPPPDTFRPQLFSHNEAR